MSPRLITQDKWAHYTAGITEPQKYFIYRVLELLSHNIPLYLDVPLLTFRGLLGEVQPIFAEARAGRVYHERVRELLATIVRVLKPRSVWSEILGNEAKDLVTAINRADSAFATGGSGALNSPPVRTAELACASLCARLEKPEGLGPVIQFAQKTLAEPTARFAYVDKLATLLVSESLQVGLSKRALLGFTRWCFLEHSREHFDERLDEWQDYLKRPALNYDVKILSSLPKLAERHRPYGCTVAGIPKAGLNPITLRIAARDPWTAALLGYEQLLDILEPYGVVQPHFVPSVPRRGIQVADLAGVTLVDLPRVLEPLPEFSIEQFMALERLAIDKPGSVNRETMIAMRATLTQLRESLTVTVESRFLHLWIATETLLGSHLAASVRGVLESLPVFVAFWSVHRRLQDLWEAVQPTRDALGDALNSVDNAGASPPDMREWMEVLANRAADIAATVDTELIKGRILWMGGALHQAADHSRPLGKTMEEVKDDVTDEIHYLGRLRGRLVHRGRVEYALDYPSRRLGAYLLRAFNSILYIVASTPAHSLEAIISSYRVAFDRATETLRQPVCDKSTYESFIDPKPPFV